MKDAVTVVGNTRLLSKLAVTDMVAIDAVYHEMLLNVIIVKIVLSSYLRHVRWQTWLIS